LNIREILSDNSLLVAIPFVGSFVAFLFEAGKLSIYDVPITYIQLDFIRIVTASACVSFFALFAVLAWVLIIDIAQRSGPYRAIVAKALILLFFIGGFFALFSAPRQGWIFLGIGIVIIIALDLLPPLFARGTGKPFRERLKEQLVNDRIIEDKRSPMNIWFGDDVLTPLSFMFFGSIAVFGIGNYWEGAKSAHWFLEDKPDYVVVTNYGDTVLAKSIDRSTGQIGDSLFIAKPYEKAPIRMVRARLELKSPVRHGPANTDRK
jgi:hypothetical protein